MAGTKTIEGYEISFERRRYGSGASQQFYCWAYAQIGDKQVMLGDPWPAVNWPKAELEKALREALEARADTLRGQDENA